MKLRTLNELTDLLDEEIGWRKRELTTIKFLVEKSRTHERPVLVRAGACLIYAHWEGFIKQAAIAYLNYVSLIGIDYCDLNPHLLAVCMRSKFRSSEFQYKIESQVELIQFFLSDMSVRAIVPWSDAIDTKSNLNSVHFRELIISLGLDYTTYGTKELLIDGRLIRYRHAVAHGNRQDLDLDEYEELHGEIVRLINSFKNDIENAAVRGMFRRK